MSTWSEITSLELLNKLRAASEHFKKYIQLSRTAHFIIGGKKDSLREYSIRLGDLGLNGDGRQVRFIFNEDSSKKNQCYTIFDWSNYHLSGYTNEADILVRASIDWIGGISPEEISEKYHFLNLKKRILQDMLLEIGNHYLVKFKYKSPQYSAVDIKNQRWCVELKCNFSNRVIASFIFNDVVLFRVKQTEISDHKPIHDWLSGIFSLKDFTKKYPQIQSLTTYQDLSQVEFARQFDDWWLQNTKFIGNAGDKTPSEQQIIHSFITTFRGGKFSDSFRPGTSMRSLVLSRSREHHLQEGQHRVLFNFNRISTEGIKIYSTFDGFNNLTVQEYNEEVEQILGLLAAVEIN